MFSIVCKHIYGLVPRIKHKHVAYYRFIDDIFFIWTGSEAELLKFFYEINSVHDTIKFNCNHSNNSINFLDTTVYISQNKLSTKLFTKSTDRPSYLHYNSYHPRAQMENIPSGQALKLKIICTENKHLQEGLKSLKTKFIQRGYKESLIEQQFSKVNEYNRNDLLKYNNKDKKTPKLTCAVVLNKGLPNIKSSIHKHWNLLHLNKGISKTFTEEPLIAYRKKQYNKEYARINPPIQKQKDSHQTINYGK